MTRAGASHLKLVKLKTVRQINNSSVIEVLKHTLKEARAGKITAVTVAMVRPDGAANAYFSNTDQASAMLGALTVAQGRFFNALESDE